MSDEPTFTPRIILKQSCPFCLRLQIFLTEAGLAENFRYLIVKDGTAEYDEVKSILEEKLGEASFPTVEIERNTFMSGSDELIDHYADEAGIDRNAMPLLTYYEHGVFPAMQDLFQENKDLTEQLGER